MNFLRYYQLSTVSSLDLKELQETQVYRMCHCISRPYRNFLQSSDSGANTEDVNENTVTEDAVRDSEILDVIETPTVDGGTTATLRKSQNIQTLSLTPNKLNSFATLRNTVGNLEAEFTQLKITHTGNIEQRTKPSSTIISLKFRRQP